MFGKNMGNARNNQKSGGLGYMLLGASAAAWWLSKDENRTKFDSFMKQAKKKLNSNATPSKEEFPVLKAGHPDPEDVEDNKMVEEGSQFGVKYYNEKEQQKK
ncbi:hypothetical protein JOC78_003100 [Bacillus ectoiniformans]|uniref:hypothetical protein n=1 Tax=Bacillus ectoiniformans TaxID=1494429 RepID=UPI003B8338B1|nr:hypothetical protein [Bacillus ectoiniformans]